MIAISFLFNLFLCRRSALSYFHYLHTHIYLHRHKLLTLLHEQNLSGNDLDSEKRHFKDILEKVKKYDSAWLKETLGDSLIDMLTQGEDQIELGSADCSKSFEPSGKNDVDHLDSLQPSNGQIEPLSIATTIPESLSAKKSNLDTNATVKNSSSIPAMCDNTISQTDSQQPITPINDKASDAPVSNDTYTKMPDSQQSVPTPIDVPSNKQSQLVPLGYSVEDISQLKDNICMILIEQQVRKPRRGIPSEWLDTLTAPSTSASSSANAPIDQFLTGRRNQQQQKSEQSSPQASKRPATTYSDIPRLRSSNSRSTVSGGELYPAEDARAIRSQEINRFSLRSEKEGEDDVKQEKRNRKDDGSRKETSSSDDVDSSVSTFWPDKTEFKQLLLEESRWRARVGGEWLLPGIKQEAKWRYFLYKKWKEFLDQGVNYGFDDVSMPDFDSDSDNGNDYEDDDDYGNEARDPYRPYSPRDGWKFSREPSRNYDRTSQLGAPTVRSTSRPESPKNGQPAHLGGNGRVNRRSEQREANSPGFNPPIPKQSTTTSRMKADDDLINTSKDASHSETVSNQQRSEEFINVSTVERRLTDPSPAELSSTPSQRPLSGASVTASAAAAVRPDGIADSGQSMDSFPGSPRSASASAEDSRSEYDRSNEPSYSTRPRYEPVTNQPPQYRNEPSTSASSRSRSTQRPPINAYTDRRISPNDANRIKSRSEPKLQPSERAYLNRRKREYEKWLNGRLTEPGWTNVLDEQESEKQRRRRASTIEEHTKRSEGQQNQNYRYSSDYKTNEDRIDEDDWFSDLDEDDYGNEHYDRDYYYDLDYKEDNDDRLYNDRSISSARDDLNTGFSRKNQAFNRKQVDDLGRSSLNAYDVSFKKKTSDRIEPGHDEEDIIRAVNELSASTIRDSDNFRNRDIDIKNMNTDVDVKNDRLRRSMMESNLRNKNRFVAEQTDGEEAFRRAWEASAARKPAGWSEPYQPFAGEVNGGGIPNQFVDEFDFSRDRRLARDSYSENEERDLQDQNDSEKLSEFNRNLYQRDRQR